MEMKDISIHDSKTIVFVGDKPKVEEMMKGSTRTAGRKTLADISNIPQQFRALNQDNKSRSSSDSIRGYIKQLQQENAALVKLLADKKAIELSGDEIHKLRVTLQILQQQNLQLAQANSQMLAELNSVKERQKTLKHELGCKDALIIAKKLELEGKPITKTCQANDSENNEVIEPQETELCTVAESDSNRHHNACKRLKSKSLASSAKKVKENDVGKARRLQIRRQSTGFKLDESKSTEDSNNLDDLPPCPSLDDDKMKANHSNPVLLSCKREDKPQEERRTSTSRPLREAAKKVQSYKEINVNVKMRRSECIENIIAR